MRFESARCPIVLIALLVISTACERAPARLVAGDGDTVIVNNQGPVRLPVQVLDKRGHILPDSGVRFTLMSGTPFAISARGSVACTHDGDATVRASLGSLATDFFLRCRPVSDVRATRMLNLVVGAPAQDLPFEAVGVDGNPVTLLAGQVTIGDSTIASVDGVRVRALATGQTTLTMRVGNRRAFTEVLAYKPSSTPEGIRPDQRIAVPVRLAGGEMRRWHLAASPESYYVTMLGNDDEPMPGLAIVGASCAPALGPHSYFCLARSEATVIVYHPQNVDQSRKLNGTLAVWRQGWRE